ncbi:zinc ribbon domain-containing protein [Borrelia sp. BU AG58]|uniref:zinc ribbon domain-containing protein n=1 Tax=Borrelia sp. BU AG58 TaxID=2887345 RepID=UPI001E60D461|nr:zinc ribbon domain-containing protein [Borrelia sp. BU AG58]UER67858.1 zinc ribbon domain-containing protein [Borrelia sp. BU AG58]
MESNIDILKNLEGIYKAKFSLEERQKSIPRYLQVKKSQIDELIGVLNELQVKFKECQKEDSSLKLGIQDINMRKTKAEEKIDSIKTQREYEALEKELQAIIDDEVAIRKKMTHVTGLKTRVDREITELKGKLEGEQSIYATESANLEEELLSVKQKLLDITDEEGKYASRMDEDFLFKFQRIIRNKSSGVVPLVENVCKGCNMILPVEFANKVRREPDDVKFCPYCSRILYYQEAFEVGLGMMPGSLADLIE